MELRKRALVVGLAVVSACAGVVRAAPVPAAQSDGFVDYMGINIHAGHYLGYPGTAYDDWEGIIDIVGDIGFRNVRDHGIEVARLNQLTDATGAKLMAITEWQTASNGVLSLNFSQFNTRMQQTRQLTGLRWIEGPNEIDGFNDPNWQANLTQWMSQIYTTAKSDPVLKNIPIVAPSLYGGPGYPNLSAYVDYGNLHQYPTGRIPMTHHDGAVARMPYVSGNKPIIATESGYNNGFEDPGADYGISEQASYKYVPRQFMDFYNAGHPHFFLYELADDIVDTAGPTGHGHQEWHWGLVREDHSYKPSAHAVKNLITHLSDVGEEFTPGSLDYTISGGNADLRQVLLQKRDGSYVLALWQDVSVYDNPTDTNLVNPLLAVTVNVNAPVTLAQTFKLDSMAAVDFTAGLSEIEVDVLDEVKLVHITLDPPTAHHWTKVGDGTWQTGTNWSNGAAAGMFHTARFGTAGASAHAVSVSSPVTVSGITFDSAASYTLSGQQITIDTPMFGALAANSGTHTVAAPLKLNRDTTITVGAAASLWVNDLVESPNAIVKKDGAGVLHVNQVRAKKLKVLEGQVQVDDFGASSVDSVSVSAGAKLDVRNTALVIRADDVGTFESGAYTGVTGQVAAGRGTGAWNTAGGITTTMPDATLTGLTTLAIALASDTPYAGGTLGGVSVAADDVIVRYTWHGDADLNGELNGDDYFWIDSHVLQSGSVFGFHFGDFDYNGEINGDDYFLLDSTILYAQSYGGPPGIAGLVAVPEPVGLGAIGVATVLGSRRRKRQR